MRMTRCGSLEDSLAGWARPADRSERAARMESANERRCMSGLRESGRWAPGKGEGGGQSLASTPAQALHEHGQEDDASRDHELLGRIEAVDVEDLLEIADRQGPEDGQEHAAAPAGERG